MKVKIFRGCDTGKLEKEINEFMDKDGISVEDIKITTDVIHNHFDHIARPLTSTTVVVMYEENDYGYYE